ncbi:Stealth CR1 domain-containing protein, partial [Streptodolium elevatio]
MGGTERAVLTQAALMAARHEVEVVSVFRTRARQFFAIPDGVRLRHLIDATNAAAPRPVAARSLGADDCVSLAALPSRYVEPAWEAVFNRLSDLELERLLRETDADIVVTPTPALMALAVQLVPSRVKTVHQEHRVSELRGISGEPLLRYAPALDALVALTEPTRTWFAETFGELAPHLATIPNAVPGGFRPGSTRVNPVVAMAGRMVPEKQIHHAIRAFGQLTDTFPEWTLRVYGEGPKLSELRNLVDELELNDNVHLLGNAPRMDEEWARASICLLTSRVEAFPLVLTEAKAAGLPCVAYDCPNGPAELIRDGVDGFLVALDDVDGLAAALARLMGDEALRNQFGTAALETLDELSPDRVGAAWESLFGEVAAQAALPGSADAKADRFARHLAGTSGGNAVLAAVPSHGTRRIASFSYKAHQVRIEALHPNLRRHGGQVCLVADHLSAADVIDRNLHLVLDVLEKSGIPYIYFNDGNLRHQVGVAEEYRQQVLDAVAERYADEAVYVAALNAGGGVMKTAMAGTLGAWNLLKAPSGIRVFQPVMTDNGTVRFAGVYGTTVSFWSDSEDGRDLENPAATTLGRILPKESLTPALLEVAGRDVSTAEPFTRTLVSSIDFPIDAVYTWVDGNDPAWNERRNKMFVANGLTPAAEANGSARYRNRDELRYSLRSIDMYAPWIRTVY